MIRIEYPPYPFRIKKENGKECIFDEFRKIWVRLTPEEWVRQNFLRYLTDVKKYPLSLVAVEKELLLGDLKKRFDILVYNAQHQPWMMVECKSMEIPLSEKVLHQLLRYNMSIPVNYLIITNGSYVYGYRRTPNGISMITELPEVTKAN